MGRVKSKAPLPPGGGWRKLRRAINNTPHRGAGGLFLLLLLLTSCKTHERIIETTSHDTLYIYRHLHDSISTTDSTVTIQKGDTVISYRYRLRTIYRIINDTTTQIRYVEKPVPVEVVKTVEVPAKLHRWQLALMWFGFLCALWYAISSYKRLFP